MTHRDPSPGGIVSIDHDQLLKIHPGPHLNSPFGHRAAVPRFTLQQRGYQVRFPAETMPGRLGAPRRTGYGSVALDLETSAFRAG